MRRVVKIVSIFIVSISYLYPKCSNKNLTLAKEFFSRARDAKDIAKEMVLLEKSLNICFTYEVAYTLIMAKIEKSSSKKERVKLYNRALEILSKIDGKDSLVKEEQSRINKILANHYKDNSILFNIYNKKASSFTEKEDSNFSYILISIALITVAIFLSKVFKK
jgi:hypothetical protein